MSNYNLEKYLNGKSPQDLMDFDYVVIKMQSGETVFSAISELDTENYCAMLPLKLATISQNGTYVSAMVEYLVGSDDVFMVLPKKSCLLVSFMSDKTITEYKNATKSVIDSIDKELADELEDDNTPANVFTFKAPTTKQ